MIPNIRINKKKVLKSFSFKNAILNVAYLNELSQYLNSSFEFFVDTFDSSSGKERNYAKNVLKSLHYGSKYLFGCLNYRV